MELRWFEPLAFSLLRLLAATRFEAPRAVVPITPSALTPDSAEHSGRHGCAPELKTPDRPERENGAVNARGGVYGSVKPAKRSPRRVVAVALGVLGVVAGALVTHSVVFIVATMDCSGFYDSGPPPPAVASPQGRLCGQYASGVGSTIWTGGFILSLIASVALIILVWRRWSWRLGLPALSLLVVLPMATAWLLDLPSDECRPEVLATHDTWQCTRGY